MTDCIKFGQGNTVNRESLGQCFWTSPSPWGDWGHLPQSSDMIADGDCVIGDEDLLFQGMTLEEMVVMHPEAMDVS